MKNEVSVSSSGDAVNEPRKPRRWDRNPFRGLDFFDFEHAPIFHGRTQAVREVLDALKKQAAAKKPFVLVVGASGSGKSSLVRAGVLPRLTEVGAVEGHGPWRCALTRPGAGGTKGDPFDVLAATLLDESALPELRISASPYEVRNLATVLRTHPDSAAVRIRHALDHLRVQGVYQRPDVEGRELEPARTGEGVEPARQEWREGAESKAHLALVVDQLEELFTGGFPLELQQGYLAALGALVRSERVFVIAALRGDFYANYEQFAELADLPDLSVRFDLQPPTSDEVGEMIRLPAEAAGLHFETDPTTGVSLDEALLEEVALTPEPLPVLEHELSQLYLKQLERNDNLLRWSDYHALGGLKEALANHAETVFSTLKCEEQGALESVMRHLVTLDGPATEGVPDCRTVPYRDLTSSPQFDDCQMAGAKGLVNRLIKEGLLRAETGPDQELVVSLTHEVLLRRWPRVAQWLSEDQDFLRKRDRLDASRRRWISKGCQTDHLLSRRNGLGEAKKLVRRSGASLVQTQIDYVQNSRAYWKKRRRVRHAIGLAVLACLAVLATVVAAIWPNAPILQEVGNESAKLALTITDLARKAPSPSENRLKKPAEEKPPAIQQNADLSASQHSALQVQLTATEAKALTAQKDAELVTSQRDALQSQLKATEVKAQQAQKDAQLAASQRDALQARLTDTQAKAELTQKSGDLAASQRDALAAQLKESEAKAQQAQKNGDLAASQRDALAAQLKESEAKAQQAQKNGELVASQRDTLQAQLKESEAKAQQAQKSGDLAASQRDALAAQLKESEAKAQQAQKNAELATSQRDALQAQLKDTQARAQQAEKNTELVASQRDAAQTQLREAEAKAQQVQKHPEQTQPANPRLNPSTSTQPPDSSVQSVQATPPIQPLDSSVQRLRTTAIPDLVSVGFPADPEARIEENAFSSGETTAAAVGPDVIQKIESIFGYQEPVKLGRTDERTPPGPQPTPLAASVETPPAETQANEGAGVAGDEAAVKRFVLEYIRAVTSDDASSQEPFFAHRVNFYGEGALSLQEIQASTERYRREWPVREWEPQGEPQILNTANPRRYEVLQPFTWKVSNGVRHEEGSATLYVRVWKNAKGEFHIVHVEQRSADLAADRPASQESQPPNAGRNPERRRRHSH